MLWWRVELDKTGAILKVEEVAQREKDGRLVCYVEANDKATACSLAKAWAENFRNRSNSAARRLRKKRLREGKCQYGGCDNPPRVRRRDGKPAVMCEAHYQSQRQSQKNPSRRIAMSDSELKEHVHARDRRNREGKLWLWGHIVLREFDERGPAAFRKWLVAKIEAKKAKAKAKIEPLRDAQGNLVRASDWLEELQAEAAE